jgi:beta-lactamase regulating signal transducer with metallopeptidase domain
VSLTPYLMTVALHAVVLSAASLILVAFIRNPRVKAALALGGLIATAVLSWLTPLRPAERPALTIPILPARLPEIEPAAPLPPLERADLTAVKQESLSPAPRSRNFQPPSILPMLWAAGTLAGLLGIAGALWRGGRWQRSLEIADVHEWSLLHDALPREMDRDAFRISAETVSPCVTGFLKPRIVIPRSLLDGSKPRELAWALRHELTHLDGQDSRWALAIRLVRSLLWWNPMVHGLAWTWSEARERTCDQAAATTGAERADYGDFLVTMAAALRPRPTRGPSMAKHGTAKRLKRRVASLLAAAPGLAPRVSRLQAVGAGLVFAAALGATSLLALEKNRPADRTGDGNLTLEKILNPEPVIGISMAWVKSAEPFGEDGRIYTAEEIRQRIEVLRKLPGTALESTAQEGSGLNSIESTFSQALIRSHQEDDVTWFFNARREREPLMEAPPWNGASDAKDYAGWVVGLGTAKGSKEGKIRVPVDASYSFFPGRHIASAILPTGSWEDLRQSAKSAVLEMPSGHAGVLDFGEVEAGVHIALVVTGRFALPWVHPFEPLDFDSAHFASLSAIRLDGIQSAKLPDDFRIHRFFTRMENASGLADPDYRRLAKLRDDARLAYQIAMDSLPGNRELVRQRNIQLEKLSSRPADREAEWKLKQLAGAISAHAGKDLHVLALKWHWEATSKAAKIRLEQLEKLRSSDSSNHLDGKARQMMEDLERRRHEW